LRNEDATACILEHTGDHVDFVNDQDRDFLLLVDELEALAMSIGLPASI
jgi:hypothetical protein